MVSGPYAPQSIDPSVVQPAAADWEDFRRQMPVASRLAYLDHAAVAPLSGPAWQALSRWCEDATTNGACDYRRWMDQIEQLRTLLAGMIGAQREEIAFVGNTTAGVNIVAEGFPWHPGDNVVIRADEFPTNQYPWLNLAQRGVETRRVVCRPGESEIDQLAAACDSKTRIISVSWVTFTDGWRHDVASLAELAHKRGALLFLDAIQGLGAFPIDVTASGVDFLAADGHKWLLGPEGAGVFYIRREHLDRLRPMGVGWNSVVHEHDFNRIELVLKPSAVRYEGGSPNTIGLTGLAASCRLLSRFGQQAIGQRIEELTEFACQRLRSIGAVIRSDRSPQHRSGIVLFDLPGRDPQALRTRCRQQGVVLSCRGGGLRISPHAYNNQEDIQRLIEALS